MSRPCPLYVGLAAAALISCLSMPAGAAVYGPEPAPFRGQEQYAGSDFSYNRTSFLDRFSFAPITDDLSRWRRRRQGFAGAVGSTTSVEFLSAMRFYDEHHLSERLSFNYRFIRDEDFDGVYDSNLIGFRLNMMDSWNLGLFGDVVRDKEDIDAQLELTHGKLGDGWLRLVCSMVDLRFNAKQEEAEYRKMPRTWFIEWMGGGASWDLHVYANHDPQLRLRHYVDQQDFTFEQTQVGARSMLQTEGGLRIQVGMDGQWGERSWRPLPAASFSPRHFERRHGELRLELGTGKGPLQAWHLGLRNFSLEERTWDGDNLALRVSRREPLLWLRYDRPVSEHLVLSPRLYQTRIDNREDDYLNPAASTDHQLIMGKIALALEWRMADGAYLVVNPTMYTHKMNFGGMNIVAWFPF